MRAYISAHGYRVACDARDVSDFADRWPCSGLHGLDGVTFAFERNGDLVDVYYRNGNSDRWDGPALAALAEDAQHYAATRPDFTRYGLELNR